MMNHILQLVVFAVAMLVAARVVPGIQVRSFGSALMFSLVFAVVDKLLFGLLVFFSIPLIVLSFGLFLLVINAALFMLADRLTPGVKVEGFGSAFLGSLVTSILSSLFAWVIGLH